MVDSWWGFIAFHSFFSINVPVELELRFKCIFLDQMVLESYCRRLIRVRMKADSLRHDWFHKGFNFKGIWVWGVSCSKEVFEFKFVFVLPCSEHKHWGAFRIKSRCLSKFSAVFNEQKAVFIFLGSKQMRLPIADL